MRPPHAQLATLIIAGLLAAAACSSAASPAPVVTSTASPSIAVTTSSPSAAPGATAPSPPASPSAAQSASPTAAPAATPTPNPTPTPVPVPPKPSGVTFDQHVREIPNDDEHVEITQTVKWRAPRSDGVEIQVFGVTACIAEPASPPPDSSGPCLVVRTPVPSSVRTLLATAPASDGEVSWTWTTARFECGEPLVYFDPYGPAYHAVVLAAYGPSGHSIFAIAEPGGWWTPAPGDIVC